MAEIFWRSNRAGTTHPTSETHPFPIQTTQGATIDISAVSLADVLASNQQILVQLVLLTQLLSDWLGADTPRLDPVVYPPIR